MAKKVTKATSNGKAKANGKNVKAETPIRTKQHFAKGLSDLLSSGKIKANVTKLFGRYHGQEHIATVRKDGVVILGKGSPSKLQGEYGSLSLAGRAIRNSETNGWLFWTVQTKDGSRVPIGTLR